MAVSDSQYINFQKYAMNSLRIGKNVQAHNTEFFVRLFENRIISYVSPPNCITNMYKAYSNCTDLTGEVACSNNVTNLSQSYYKCTNLTGTPVCGTNVTNMYSTYSYCNNLTGNPVCGNNVTDMGMTYNSCTNLTGSPVCGDKVTNMYGTYSGCTNLTGISVCRDNVTDMRNAYRNCYKITGVPRCGNNVIDMHETYYKCANLYGIFDMTSTINVQNITNCFTGRNTYRELKILVMNNSITKNTILNNTTKMVGVTLAWTVNTSPSYGTIAYYNPTYNINVVCY